MRFAEDADRDRQHEDRRNRNHQILNSVMKEKVLEAMRQAGKPVSAGDVTKALGADRKEVDKAFAELKKEGAIVSPVRCKWAPAN